MLLSPLCISPQQFVGGKVKELSRGGEIKNKKQKSAWKLTDKFELGRKSD